MRFGNLAAQDQSDPAAFRFCREERNEKIGRIGKPRAFILDPNLDVASRLLPTNPHATAPVSSAASAALRNRLINS